MLILRLESSNGIGPFINEHIKYNIKGTDYYDPTLYPTTNTEFNSFKKKEYLGVKNLKDLDHWFPLEQMENLASKGYKLVMYSSESFKLGKNQVLFKKEKKLGMLSLESYLN